MDKREVHPPQRTLLQVEDNAVNVLLVEELLAGHSDLRSVLNVNSGGAVRPQYGKAAPPSRQAFDCRASCPRHACRCFRGHGSRCRDCRHRDPRDAFRFSF
jgi:hypothetical protein